MLKNAVEYHFTEITEPSRRNFHNDIDMNPHFSQNILNTCKGIFRMWIHRYIAMYMYPLAWIIVFFSI